jgi:hypothetical protein
MNREMCKVAEKEEKNQVCLEAAGFSIAIEGGVLRFFHRSMLSS